nr:Os06g0167150 [Ipomoea batatas]
MENIIHGQRSSNNLLIFPAMIIRDWDHTMLLPIIGDWNLRFIIITRSFLIHRQHNTRPAKRAIGVGFKPRIDARHVESMAASGQQPEPIVVLKFAEANRAI